MPVLFLARSPSGAQVFAYCALCELFILHPLCTCLCMLFFIAVVSFPF